MRISDWSSDVCSSDLLVVVMDDAALDGARFRTAERFDHRGEIGLLRPPATINRTLPNLIGASVFQAFLGRAVERFEGPIEFLQHCLDIAGARRRGAAYRLRFRSDASCVGQDCWHRF